VILDFKSIGGSDELTLFHSEGGLARKIKNMRTGSGMIPGKPKPQPKAQAKAKPKVAAPVGQVVPQANGRAADARQAKPAAGRIGEKVNRFREKAYDPIKAKARIQDTLAQEQGEDQKQRRY
jgi:hypothetical protein